MEKQSLPGCLSYPGGEIPFGTGKPTLCVNDQCGYLVEDASVQKQVLSGDFSPLLELAEEGKRKGMPIFNVQIMVPPLLDKERDLFPRIVKAIYQETGCGIALDTKNPEVLEQALEIFPYKALCNCINGEQHTLDTMLPIIAQYGGAVGTSLVDEQGIPDTLERRLSVAKRILHASKHAGIKQMDIIIDAVCLPSGVVPNSMPLTLETLKAFKTELGVPTLLGSSNAGYMMPHPSMIDAVYFIAAVSWGLDVAMISPYTCDIEWLMATVDFLMGIDPFAERFLELHRQTDNS